MKARPLDRKVIERLVAPRTVGFYRLGTVCNGTFERRYIGRSDTGLRRRLLEHAVDGRHTHFQAEPTETIYEAFRRECAAWHRANGELENVVHPAAPKFLGYTCPYCQLRASLRETPPQKEVLG